MSQPLFTGADKPWLANPEALQEELDAMKAADNAPESEPPADVPPAVTGGVSANGEPAMADTGDVGDPDHNTVEEITPDNDPERLNALNVLRLIADERIHAAHLGTSLEDLANAPWCSQGASYDDDFDDLDNLDGAPIAPPAQPSPLLRGVLLTRAHATTVDDEDVTLPVGIYGVHPTTGIVSFDISTLTDAHGAPLAGNGSPTSMVRQLLHRIRSSDDDAHKAEARKWVSAIGAWMEIVDADMKTADQTPDPQAVEQATMCRILIDTADIRSDVDDEEAQAAIFTRNDHMTALRADEGQVLARDEAGHPVVTTESLPTVLTQALKQQATADDREIDPLAGIIPMVSMGAGYAEEALRVMGRFIFDGEFGVRHEDIYAIPERLARQTFEEAERWFNAHDTLGRDAAAFRFTNDQPINLPDSYKAMIKPVSAGGIEGIFVEDQAGKYLYMWPADPALRSEPAPPATGP
jgi:hypothetical protein